MSSRFTKTLADEGVINTSGINTYHVPDQGYYNPSTSYFSQILTVSTTESAGKATGIHSVYPKIAYGAPLDNSFLVKDAYANSNKYGNLELTNNVNVLSANLDFLRRDFDDIVASNYKTLAQYNNCQTSCIQSISPLVKLEMYGSQNSQYTPMEVMIPLKSVYYGIGNLNMWDSNTLGGVKLQLRWDPLAYSNILEFEEDLPHPEDAPLECDDRPANTSLYTITTTDTFNNQTNPLGLGLWVGCSVSVYAGGNSASTIEAPLSTTIVAITPVNASTNTTGKFLITLANSLIPTDATQPITGIRLFCNAAASITPSWTNPQLVLEQLYPSQQTVDQLSKLKQLVYHAFEFEMCDVPAVTSFNRLFPQINSNVKNLLFCKVAADELLAYTDNITSYRLQVNNVDKTNCDVKTGQALYIDQLEQAVSEFQNLTLKNLNKVYTSLNNEVFLVACSLPEDGQIKQVQITLNASEAMTASTLYVFKETEKIINV